MTAIRRWVEKNSDLAPIFAVMAAVLAANVILQPNLLTMSSIRDLSVQLAPFVLVTMAQTMVMLLAGIDLAVGSLVSLASAALAANLGHGWSDWPIVLAVVAGCGLLGTITGLFVAYLGLPSLVVTLATSFIWAGLALTILPQPGGVVPEALTVWITGEFGGVPMIVIILMIVLLAWHHIRKLPIGLRIYAVGNAPRAARVTGLSLLKAHGWGFGLAGVFAGLAGVVLSAQIGSGDAVIGMPFTLSSIAAAVIGGVSLMGGKGRIAGAVAGAIIIGMLGNLLLYAGVSSFYQFIVQGALLLSIVALTAWRRLRTARSISIAPNNIRRPRG